MSKPLAIIFQKSLDEDRTQRVVIRGTASPAINVTKWRVLSSLSLFADDSKLFNRFIRINLSSLFEMKSLYMKFLDKRNTRVCDCVSDGFYDVGGPMTVLSSEVRMNMIGYTEYIGQNIAAIYFLTAMFIVADEWDDSGVRLYEWDDSDEWDDSETQVTADHNDSTMLIKKLINKSRPKLHRTRVLLDFLLVSTLFYLFWASCAFCYYGIVLMTTELFEAKGSLCSVSGTASQYSCSADCRPLEPEDYLDLLWTTLAEFPGIFFTIIVIEKLGRKKTMALEFIIFVISIIFLFICTSSRGWLTFILFVARGIISGVFQAAYVYTPEVYPTRLRAVGVGTCSAMARFGAMVTPLVAQVMTRTSIHLATATYGLAAIMAIVAALMLPIETRGRAMS
ncbi:unnamed protein product, partial [Meganyctiphanes norvegica]